MKTVIGIDNGTQSTKVIFYDFEKKSIAASASSPHDMISKDDGTREHKAKWWIQALENCFKQIDPEIKKQLLRLVYPVSSMDLSLWIRMEKYSTM